MDDLNRIIHEPARLRIMMTLSASDLADHAQLRNALELTKGNLSSHMARLERAGYVEVVKSFVGKIPHTNYLLTDLGREALQKYLDALGEIMALAVAPETHSIDASLLDSPNELWADSEDVLQT